MEDDPPQSISTTERIASFTSGSSMASTSRGAIEATPRILSKAESTHDGAPSSFASSTDTLRAAAISGGSSKAAETSCVARLAITTRPPRDDEARGSIGTVGIAVIVGSIDLDVSVDERIDRKSARVFP